MSNPTKIAELQNLLYVWLSKFEKRSLENIKAHCDFLNENYKLNLSYPNWSIFWPLVFNGLVDHTGRGYYALTKPIIIDYTSHFVYINNKPNSINSSQLSIGIFLSNKLDNPRNYSVVKINSLSILKKFPAVKDVVDSFNESLRDEQDLEYYNIRAGRGIAKLKLKGLTRYFSIPEEIYMRELPDRTINPEAFAISYCYSRTINNEPNGIYDEKNQKLALAKFGLQYLLYRSLLLHSLAYREMPESNEKYYYFRNIPKTYIKQLNRIFCNSIVYE